MCNARELEISTRHEEHSEKVPQHFAEKGVSADSEMKRGFGTEISGRELSENIPFDVGTLIFVEKSGFQNFPTHRGG